MCKITARSSYVDLFLQGVEETRSRASPCMPVVIQKFERPKIHTVFLDELTLSWAGLEPGAGDCEAHLDSPSLYWTLKPPCAALHVQLARRRLLGGLSLVSQLCRQTPRRVFDE